MEIINNNSGLLNKKKTNKGLLYNHVTKKSKNQVH